MHALRRNARGRVLPVGDRTVRLGEELLVLDLEPVLLGVPGRVCHQLPPPPPPAPPPEKPPEKPEWPEADGGVLDNELPVVTANEDIEPANRPMFQPGRPVYQ